MAYEYRYGQKKNTKHIVIAAVSAALIFSFYLITSNTAYVSYTESLETELNRTISELAAIEGEKTQCLKDLLEKISVSDKCSAELSEKSANLIFCENDRTNMKTYISSVNSSLASCMSEKQSLQNIYANESGNFRALVKNSAASICCSYRDVQRGSAVSWSITNNSIVCEGSYVVNCSTGVTSY